MVQNHTHNIIVTRLVIYYSLLTKNNGSNYDKPRNTNTQRKAREHLY